MVCRSCGANVGESDRFCNACGARLTPQADPGTITEPTAQTSAAATGSDDDDDHEEWFPPEDHTVHEAESSVSPAPATEGFQAPDPEQTSVHMAAPTSPSSDEATGEWTSPSAPSGAAGDAREPQPATAEDRDSTNEMRAPNLYDLADEPDSDVTSQLAAMAGGRAVAQPPPTPTPAPSSDVTDRTAVETRPAPPAADVTTTMASTRSSTTGEVPASYSPYAAPAARYADRYPADEPHPHRFRFRVMLIFAILAAGAGACAAVTDVVKITTDAANPLFETGTWMVNDFGTNSTVAMGIAGGVMVLGALLGCFGFRWGGGLAGGAGLALAGWSALIIGQAEVPLAVADTVLKAQQTESFRVTLTRDLGYGLVVGAGVLGVVVFITSLTSIRRDRATNLNPWVAALGAAASLVAAAGPLIPLNDASIENNWSSSGGVIDLPTMFFVGRLAQVGLVAFTGLVGFLLVRRYGLGLAAGGFTAVAWLAATALLEQTDNPIGPAIANPGAELGDTIPHAVTIGGLAVALFCLLMAAFEVALSRSPDD